MLTPDQVLPFLRHDDEMIRNHAVRYFAQAHDPAPLTVDDVWAAAEHLGLDERGVAVLGLIEHVPQNDASTDRLLAAVERMAAVDDPILEELLFVVDLIDLDQLRRHHARILATPGIDDEQRAALNERLELANLPHDQLWECLVRESEAIHAAADASVHWLNADRIVQALAQHGPAAAERAMAVLAEPPDPESALPLFAIDLLGILRHRPALDRLLELFAATDEEDDGQHEALMNAIPSVGGTDAIPAIETAWGAHGSTYQLFAAGVLERIKHPQSEETLLRLIDGQMEDYVRDRVSSALTALCTTAGLPRLREMVLKEEYDPTMIDLKEALVVCALMAGYDFPELSTLREEVIAKEVDRDRRLERLMDDPDFLDKTEGAADLDDLLYGEDYDDDYDELPPQLDDRAPRVVAPIHNELPKVGRNDPCPCGSGKKYKKCCLDKTA